MILTKKEIVQKLIDGKKLTPVTDNNCYCYYDDTYNNPFRFVNPDLNINSDMEIAWAVTEWELYEEKPTWWEPKDDEKAYYIDDSGQICTGDVWNYEIDKGCVNQGNVFKTKEEAEREAKLREAKYKVKRRVWELNDGYFINFKLYDDNYSFHLYENRMKCSVSSSTKYYPNWQYLKSKELVEQLIKEMEKDLLLIRGE